MFIIEIFIDFFTLEYRYLLSLQKDYKLQRAVILKLLKDLIFLAIHFPFHIVYIYFYSKMLV